MAVAARKTSPAFTPVAKSAQTLPSRDGRLTVDLEAICRNYVRLGQLAGGVEVAAVVKANAYGLGAIPVSRAIAAAGCTTFFVSNLEEALELRDHGGPRVAGAAIYTLDGVQHDSLPLYQHTNIRPVLNSMEEIALWAARCRRIGQQLPAAVHIDTGMRRLGLDARDCAALIEDPGALRDFELVLWVSHLACADDPASPHNAAQVERLNHVLHYLPGAPVSFANSAGIMLGQGYVFDQVRPGIALYGGNPRPGLPNPFAPVVTLDVRILQLHMADAGDTVGYGAIHTFKEPRRLATLAAGYADGYFRAAGDRGHVLITGRKAPIVGRISMDTMTVDVTDIPWPELTKADHATLIGAGLSVDDVADFAGTISYEVLTALGGRYERRYAGGQDES